jgi:hypothetical protein
MLGDPIRWINTTGFGHDNPRRNNECGHRRLVSTFIRYAAESHIVTLPQSIFSDARNAFRLPMWPVHRRRAAVLAHRRGERGQ